MVTIYALFPGTIPEFSQLEDQLSDTCTIVPLDKVELLSNYREEKAVVLVGGTPERINSLVGMMRSIAPRLGYVIVINKESLDKLDTATLNQADVLVVPTHANEIYARINAASHTSELRQLIEESAQLDEVTELYNYHYFIKRLGEEMSLAKRHLSPVTCVIVSISYYDVYMDSYGYDFVSGFMHQVAKTVKEHIRREDIAARLGDSEIAFMLPRSTEKGALALTSRILSKVESLPIYMGDQIEHLHLNAGIAGFPSVDEADLDADTLIRYARHALHQARCSDNKNVVLFSEMKPHVG